MSSPLMVILVVGDSFAGFARHGLGGIHLLFECYGAIDLGFAESSPRRKPARRRVPTSMRGLTEPASSQHSFDQ
jgi:hypothetical protein